MDRCAKGRQEGRSKKIFCQSEEKMYRSVTYQARVIERRGKERIYILIRRQDDAQREECDNGTVSRHDRGRQIEALNIDSGVYNLILICYNETTTLEIDTLFPRYIFTPNE